MNFSFNLFSNKQKDSVAGHSQNKIIIYQGELDYLSKCILEYSHLETGGNLFGLRTPFGIPFIQYVIGPGPEAYRHETQFRQDFEFLDKQADKLIEEHALHHIGTWHSHHSLNLDHPSGGDVNSTLSGMKECRLSSFLLLIGNYRNGCSSVNAFRFHSDNSIQKLKWVILPGESPIRTMFDQRHPNLIYNPLGKANMLPLEKCSLIGNNGQRQMNKPSFDKNYWLSNPENQSELSVIIDFLKSRHESVKMYRVDDSLIEIRLRNNQEVFKFLFDKTFPAKAPRLMIATNKEIKYKVKPKWNVEGNAISEAFIRFYNAIEI